MSLSKLTTQLQFALDGEITKRFHTVNTIKDYTVGQHSFTTAYLCVLLTNNNPSANLLRAALVHDLAEHQAGDMPSPAKRTLQIGDLVEQMETQLLVDNQWAVDLTPDEAHTLKIADIFAGMISCITERGLGNKFIVPVFMRWHNQAIEVEPILCQVNREDFPVGVLFNHIVLTFHTLQFAAC